MTDPIGPVYERLLVVRCQTGDGEAFAELVAAYTPRLRYYVRKLLGPAADADDLLQDVWFAVFRAVPRLADPAAFPAWVYRIARDRALRELRGRTRIPDPLPDANEIGEPDDDAEEFTADDAAAVHAALDTLAPDHREVLVLRFLEEMSYEAIAGVVGGPVGTVRSRLHYAKRALRRALERTVTRE